MKLRAKIAAFILAGSATAVVTDQVLDHYMEQLQPEFKALMIAKADRLQEYIDTDQVKKHGPFVKWIDAGGSPERAQALVAGLRAMAAASDDFEYRVLCSDKFTGERGAAAAYAWVFKSGYPHISFCNLVHWMLDAYGMSLVVHEASHFNPPHGMGTDDHDPTYSAEISMRYAIEAPDTAIDTAYNIENFAAEPLAAPPRQPVDPALLGTLIQVHSLLLEN